LFFCVARNSRAIRASDDGCVLGGKGLKRRDYPENPHDFDFRLNSYMLDLRRLS